MHKYNIGIHTPGYKVHSQIKHEENKLASYLVLPTASPWLECYLKASCFENTQNRVTKVFRCKKKKKKKSHR